MSENRSGSEDSKIHEPKLNYDALKQQAATKAVGIKDKAVELGKGALNKMDDAREPAAAVMSRQLPPWTKTLAGYPQTELLPRLPVKPQTSCTIQQITSVATIPE